MGCRGVEGGDASVEYKKKKKQVGLIGAASVLLQAVLVWLVAAINAPACWNTGMFLLFF